MTDFPERKQKRKVSEGGGVGPRWSKDGKELYYVNRSTLFAVKLIREPEFTLESPEELFEARRGNYSFVPHYDVSSDGNFLVREPVDEAPRSIRLVQNWFAAFKDRQNGVQ